LGDHDRVGHRHVRGTTRIASGRSSPRITAYWLSGRLSFERIALNRDQIDEYNPPPNRRDERQPAPSYAEEHGYESWELDALPPDALAELVPGKIEEHLDRDLYEEWGLPERPGAPAAAARLDNWAEIASYADERFGEVSDVNRPYLSGGHNFAKDSGFSLMETHETAKLRLRHLISAHPKRCSNGRVGTPPDTCHEQMTWPGWWPSTCP